MQTKGRVAKKSFVSSPWQGPAGRHNLLLQMAKDAEKLAAQGLRIKELRSFARVSQEAVARGINVTVRAYQRWEGGVGDPEPENLKNLASYFGTSEDYIEYGVMKQPTPDLMASKEPGDVEERLRALEVVVSRLSELVQLLRAETATRDAEVLKRIDAALPPMAGSQS